MTEESAKSLCFECKRPLVEIDNRGRRLTGCMTCNIWWSADDKKIWAVRRGSTGASRYAACVTKRERPVGWTYTEPLPQFRYGGRGDDKNDGRTPETPVYSWERALKLCDGNTEAHLMDGPTLQQLNLEIERRTHGPLIGS